jgi:hypothetical protein
MYSLFGGGFGQLAIKFFVQDIITEGVGVALEIPFCSKM